MRSIGLVELLIIAIVVMFVVQIMRARGGVIPRPRANGGGFAPAGFCTKCGQPLTPGGSFCAFCGAHQA